jgi:hypothetical protein
MKKTAALLASVIAPLVAGLGIATSGNAFAQSHAIHNSQSGNTPTYGGATARGYNFRYGTMWNGNGSTLRPQTGTSYNYGTGAVSPIRR